MALNLPLMIGESLAIPILINFAGGEKLDKLLTSRKIVLGSMVTFFVLTVANIAQEQSSTTVRRVVSPSTTTTTQRSIKPSSGVTVNYNSFIDHPVDEFYSGAAPYPENEHIYVD